MHLDTCVHMYNIIYARWAHAPTTHNSIIPCWLAEALPRLLFGIMGSREDISVYNMYIYVYQHIDYKSTCIYNTCMMHTSTRTYSTHIVKVLD